MVALGFTLGSVFQTSFFLASLSSSLKGFSISDGMCKSSCKSPYSKAFLTVRSLLEATSTTLGWLLSAPRCSSINDTNLMIILNCGVCAHQRNKGSERKKKVPLFLLFVCDSWELEHMLADISQALPWDSFIVHSTSKQPVHFFFPSYPHQQTRYTWNSHTRGSSLHLPAYVASHTEIPSV